MGMRIALLKSGKYRVTVNIAYDIDIVQDKYVLRHVVAAGTELALHRAARGTEQQHWRRPRWSLRAWDTL